MKVVILAGGLGTRLSEETSLRPKPMVEVGGRPILWHIMKIFSAYGFNEFIICCGYKGYSIKEYFFNYYRHNSDLTIDLESNELTFHHARSEPWRVTCVDTGDYTMTGGRLLRAAEFIGEEDFFLTYGDGVGNVDIAKLALFHRSHGGAATLTSVSPPGRFGALDIDNATGRITEFKEKPTGDGGRINGGFFVLGAKVFDLIDGDECVWEQEPLMSLARDNELFAYRHDGFWQPMDTLRDKQQLQDLWDSGNAPWRIW